MTDKRDKAEPTEVDIRKAPQQIQILMLISWCEELEGRIKAIESRTRYYSGPIGGKP